MKQNRHCYHEVLDFALSLNIEASSDYSLFGCYDKSGGNLECRISTCDVLEILDKDCQDENKSKEILQSIERKKVNIMNLLELALLMEVVKKDKVREILKQPGGWDINSIKEWLGHADISTTANIYAHISHRKKVSLAQDLDKTLVFNQS